MSFFFLVSFYHYTHIHIKLPIPNTSQPHPQEPKLKSGAIIRSPTGSTFSTASSMGREDQGVGVCVCVCVCVHTCVLMGAHMSECNKRHMQVCMYTHKYVWTCRLYVYTSFPGGSVSKESAGRGNSKYTGMARFFLRVTESWQARPPGKKGWQAVGKPGGLPGGGSTRPVLERRGMDENRRAWRKDSAS